MSLLNDPVLTIRHVLKPDLNYRLLFDVQLHVERNCLARRGQEVQQHVGVLEPFPDRASAKLGAPLPGWLYELDSSA